MIIMSLRGAFAATWQSPIIRGDCFAIARNDMQAKVNSLRELWQQTDMITDDRRLLRGNIKR